MRHVPGKSSILALAAAGALLLAQGARAATTYVELSDTGTTRTLNFSPLSISNVALASPYGGGVVTPSGGGWLITFSPTLAFAAGATNAGGGMSQTTDGKIDFTLTFDHPLVLTAYINEGGTYSTAGDGFVGVTAGGVVAETLDPVPQTISASSSAASFNASANTWTSQIYLGSFGQAFSSYEFSIDNLLSAEADASGALGTANIAKTYFSIYIPPPNGSNPTPLPLAAAGGAGLGALALRLRKRLAR